MALLVTTVKDQMETTERKDKRRGRTGRTDDASPNGIACFVHRRFFASGASAVTLDTPLHFSTLIL